MLVPIYIKLGTASQWDDERLDFHLNSGITKGILDFSNINDHIINGLNALEIVQITEAEYYGIGPSGGGGPIIINPPTLATITQFMGPCPNPAFIMFGYYNNQWYKILWSTLQTCLGGGGGGGAAPLRFRVGNPADVGASDLPHDGDASFINAFFTGTTKEHLLVTRNGIELYNKDLIDPANYTGDDAMDFYEVHADATANKFKVNALFANKDIITIRKI